MKRRDIDRTLKQAGWIISGGGRHDLATHPQKPGVRIPIPRHKEIKETTAKCILRDAGLK